MSHCAPPDPIGLQSWLPTSDRTTPKKYIPLLKPALGKKKRFIYLFLLIILSHSLVTWDGHSPRVQQQNSGRERLCSPESQIKATPRNRSSRLCGFIPIRVPPSGRALRAACLLLLLGRSKQSLQAWKPAFEWKREAKGGSSVHAGVSGAYVHIGEHILVCAARLRVHACELRVCLQAQGRKCGSHRHGN